jgi:Sulfotransferase family
VIYLLGYSRSGSTLIEDVISKELQIPSLGEVKYFLERGVLWEEKCSCGFTVKECAFWSKVSFVFAKKYNPDQIIGSHLKYLISLNEKFESTRWFFLNLLMLKGRKFKEYAGTQNNLSTSIMEVLDYKNYIDSSKMPARLFWLSRQQDAKIKVIFVIRDPRAVAWSCGRIVKRNEANLLAGGGLGEMPRFGFFSAIMRWALNSAMSLLVLRLSKCDYLTVKYEDFVSEKEKSIHEIECFLLEETSPVAMLEDLNHSISGNPRRMTGGLKSIKIDEEWKVRLPKWKSVCAYILLFPFMALFRYKI